MLLLENEYHDKWGPFAHQSKPGTLLMCTLGSLWNIHDEIDMLVFVTQYGSPERH